MIVSGWMCSLLARAERMDTERRFRITVLVENTSGRADLLAEHGLSFLVETGGLSGLFDTGQTDALLHNARVLGADLSRLSWIALSHGHYDHTGGLMAVLGMNAGVPIFAHPAVFWHKFAGGTGTGWRSNGIPFSQRATERGGGVIRLVQRPQEIAPNLLMTGEIPRRTDFETAGARFYTQHEGEMAPDLFLDDQALALRTSKGTVVLLGCAHAGVVNTLQHIRGLTAEDPVHAVIGGMHLGNASEERIAQTIAAFRALDVRKIGFAHCTGQQAVQAFYAAFGDRCFLCPAGTVLEF